MTLTLDPINYYYYPSVRISATQKVESPVFSLALRHTEVYLNGLIVQWNRMVEDSARQAELMDEGLTSNTDAAKAHAQYSDRLALDIHFHLICWDKINKHFRAVSEATSNQSNKDAWKGIGDLAEKASRARDFFEHLDKAVAKGDYGERGYTFAVREFKFRYVDRSRGTIFEREVSIGRTEVEKVMKAYERVLSSLGADLGSIVAF